MLSADKTGAPMRPSFSFRPVARARDPVVSWRPQPGARGQPRPVARARDPVVSWRPQPGARGQPRPVARARDPVGRAAPWPVIARAGPSIPSRHAVDRSTLGAPRTMTPDRPRKHERTRDARRGVRMGRETVHGIRRIFPGIGQKWASAARKSISLASFPCCRQQIIDRINGRCPSEKDGHRTGRSRLAELQRRQVTVTFQGSSDPPRALGTMCSPVSGLAGVPASAYGQGREWHHGSAAMAALASRAHSLV